MRKLQSFETAMARAVVYRCAEFGTWIVKFYSRGVSPGSWVYMSGADYETEDKTDAIGTARLGLGLPA